MAEENLRSTEPTQSDSVTEEVQILKASPGSICVGTTTDGEDYDFPSLQPRERLTLGVSELLDAWRQFRAKRTRV